MAHPDRPPRRNVPFSGKKGADRLVRTQREAGKPATPRSQVNDSFDFAGDTSDDIFDGVSR